MGLLDDIDNQMWHTKATGELSDSTTKAAKRDGAKSLFIGIQVECTFDRADLKMRRIASLDGVNPSQASPCFALLDVPRLPPCYAVLYMLSSFFCAASLPS